MSVANGYIGINVAALGPFFEFDTPVDGDNVNGWPLFQRRQTFATVGGFWDSQPNTNESNFPWLSQYGSDSAISGIPHWSGIVLDLGNGVYLGPSTDSRHISNFSSMVDLKQGVMNWAYTWTPNSMASFQISYQMFAHKVNVTQGFVKLEVTSKNNSNVTIVNVLDGDCAVRSTFAEKGESGGLIYSAVRPDGVSNVTAYVYAGMMVSGANSSGAPSIAPDSPYAGNNKSSMAQAVKAGLQAGQTATFTKYVGIASSDGFANPNSTANDAASAAMKIGYDASLKSHVAEWAAIFPSNSVDDYSYPENGTLPHDPYLIESAITAVTNPYYLLQNTISANALAAVSNASINSHSISVGGLGSDSYAGQVFWDAEIWMQPGLVAAHPQAAQGIANYRTARYDEALANAQTSYQSSKNKTKFSSSAAVYPWTSGRYGNCTATGPCFDYEYHINGDIAQEFVNYFVASGDAEMFQTQLFPVYDSIATFFSELLTKNGSTYVLNNMTDPDEYANMVDDGGFTMPLIAETLTNANMFRSMFNKSQNTTWVTQAANVFIGRDEKADIILEYSTMNGSIEVKQADVVLNTFPLGYTGENYTQQSSLSDLDYYASKQSPNGPGMTYAIFSIVANEVSPSGCSAYTYQQYSERPYMRAPWFQFSEQLSDDYATNGNTHPAFPFLTGHGGANQVVLFGYLGLRLVPDNSLHIDPALPPQIPQVRYRTFYWQGWPIKAFSNYTHTTLTRSASMRPFAQANMTYATTPISVQVGSGGPTTTQTSYTLGPNGTVTVPNRRPADTQTIQGNLAQCAGSVTSTDPFEQGQFPLAAVDGAASTKWQPSIAKQNASLTVSLPAGQKVAALYFDWAQAPPVNFSVVFHNTSAAAGGTVVATMTNVNASAPYDAKTAADITLYSSNTTTIRFDQVGAPGIYTASYATLTIIGSQATKDVTNGTGATVAEWAVVAAEKSVKPRRHLGGDLELEQSLEGPVFFPTRRQRERIDFGAKESTEHVDTRSFDDGDGDEDDDDSDHDRRRGERTWGRYSRYLTPDYGRR